MGTKGRGRTKEQILKDRSVIADMYLRGIYQEEIGKAVGLSRPQVSYELKQIREEWLKSSLQNFDEMKAKELAKLDKLEQECWDAWKKSQEDKETKIVEMYGKGGSNEKKSIKKEKQTGNVTYLSVIKDCIRSRCKILGFDAPQVYKNIELTDEELDRAIQQELEKRAHK